MPTEHLTRNGITPGNQVLVQEVVCADAEVSRELRLAENARVVHLSNLRLADQLPFSIEDMYFPADRFPKLAEMDLNNRSVYTALEKHYNAHPQEALDIVTAGSATRQEARLLGINKGAPVMRLRRTSLDRDALPWNTARSSSMPSVTSSWHACNARNSRNIRILDANEEHIPRCLRPRSPRSIRERRADR